MNSNNPWRDTLRIHPVRLAQLRKEQTEEHVHETMSALAVTLGYPFYALGAEVWKAGQIDNNKPFSVKTEMTLDENGDFEVYFLVKDGKPLAGPQGPIPFLDAAEARKASLRFGGSVKSVTELRKAHEDKRIIMPGEAGNIITGGR